MRVCYWSGFIGRTHTQYKINLIPLDLVFLSLQGLALRGLQVGANFSGIHTFGFGFKSRLHMNISEREHK